MRVDELSVRLGGNIRSMRLSRGFSQEALAIECGLHRTYIGGVERGERNITIQTLVKIASALNVDPIVLLQEPGQWSSPNQEKVSELPN